MLQKKQIETILRVNGVDVNSPDDEIKSVLLSASFNDKDVETAIMILRENTVTNTSTVEGLHKVFRTNQKLSSNEISNLLGFSVDIHDIKNESFTLRKNRRAENRLGFIFVLATLMALVGMFLVMYIYKVGLFHPSVSSLN